MDNIITRAKLITDPTRETLVIVETEGGRSWARLASRSWFSRFSGAQYAVRRRFDPPQTVPGKVTRVLNQESGEQHEVVPRITVHGVAEEKLLKTAQLFHMHYDEQESYLIGKVDEYLQRYIASDSDPIRALFEPGVNKTWDHRIQRDIREELGLDVRVDIADDPIVSPWIGKIRGHPARGCVFSFRPLNSERIFKLTLSVRIAGVAFRHWNALKNRGHRNLAVDEEMAAIEERIRRILGPVFSSFPSAALASTHGGFWKCLGQTLTKGVGAEIEKEFGCRIEITDVIRDKSELEDNVDKKGDPELLARLEKWSGLRTSAMDNYADILQTMDFDLTDAAVVAARDAVNEIDAEVEKLRKQIATEYQIKSLWEEAKPDFNLMRDAIDRTVLLLNLPPGAVDTAMLIEDGHAPPTQRLADAPKAGSKQD